jgi:hypothetical protein
MTVEFVETKTIPASNSVYSYSSLPRLDSPPTNAHSTFQQNFAGYSKRANEGTHG